MKRKIRGVTVKSAFKETVFFLNMLDNGLNLLADVKRGLCAFLKRLI